MEKLKIGHDIGEGLFTILITSRTDIFGATYVLGVIPSRQEYVSYRIGEKGELSGGVYYSACAFHMAYEEYLSRF